MSFSQLFFIFAFLPLTVLIYYITSGNKLVLLVASLVFYASGSPDHIILLMLLCCITALISIRIESVGRAYPNSMRKKLWLVLGIALNITVLGYYKYVDFICQQFGIAPPFNQSAIIPLGISFYTFKAISLIIDAYRGSASLDGKFLNGITYLSFFAHIQSGPISRFSDKGWNDSSPALTWGNLSEGIQRFAIGLSKKVIIADSLLKIANNAFSAAPENLSASFAWLGAVCYSMQLFFDFSGYSDMAIGISNMFGYSCTENFNYPYMTRSISEFWRRWHISLGAWFRDYVYIPMGGSRVNNRLRLYFNLLVVWLLTGLWHGANWTFIVWGLIYFALISLEKTFKLPNKTHHPIIRSIYRMVCLSVIIFLWVIFRSPTLSYGLQYIRAMVIPHAVPLADKRALFLFKDNIAFILMGLMFCFPIVPWFEKRLMKHRQLYNIWSILFSIIIVLGFLWSVSFVVTNTNNPFLYANF